MVFNPEINLNQLGDLYEVEIHFDKHGWYLTHGDLKICSFDLPPDLFEIYAKGGYLSPMKALRLKQEELSEIQAIFTDFDRNYTRIITFRLDVEWLERTRNNVQDILLERSKAV